MKFDHYFTVDCRKLNDTNDELFNELRNILITHGYVKVKCENVCDGDYHNVCLNLINALGGVGCPYGRDPNGLVWPVKVLALDSDPSSVHLPGTNVDRELQFHTDCSYEDNAPNYIALYVVQRDQTDEGGKFQMVRTKEILDKLSSKTKRLLSDETYKIIVRPAYSKDGKNSVRIPIILANERMRYQPDLVDKYQLEQEPIEKQVAIAELNSIIFSKDKLNIFRPSLENYMMIFFNNHQFLHGRTKIQDVNRHLLRVRFNLINK